MIFAACAQGEIDDVVPDGLRQCHRVRIEEVTPTINEVDDLQQGGFADRVLSPICTFNNVEPGMEFYEGPSLASVFELW